MKHRYLILSLLFTFASCSGDSNKLEEALKLAKENRAELQKVLNYYKKNPEDSLKYKAACFLIENMPGHYSFKDTSAVMSFYNEFDSL